MALRRYILQSGLFSITLHIALLGMLVISFDFAGKPLLPPPRPNQDIVKAVTVDNEQVQQELQRIKDAENEKLKQQQELEKKLKDLQSRAARAERQRKEEEKRLADAKTKQQAEKKQRELEQQKLAQLKKEQQELENKRRLEEEEKKRKEVADQKRKEQERKRAEEERKRKEQEQALKQQLAEEQRQREAELARQDQQMLQSIAADIYRRVVNNFNKSGLPTGLECELTVRTIPGGEVVNVAISRSSGNDIFDRRAIAAVEKASPLPLPKDAATFERLKLRQIAFRFRPED